MLIAKKKHADMKQELHPHHYYSTKVKVQDEVDRDDDLGDDTEDEDWRWPHKVTNHKDKLKVEAMDKVFNVSPVLSAGGVKVRLLLQSLSNLFNVQVSPDSTRGIKRPYYDGYFPNYADTY